MSTPDDYALVEALAGVYHGSDSSADDRTACALYAVLADARRAQELHEALDALVTDVESKWRGDPHTLRHARAALAALAPSGGMEGRVPYPEFCAHPDRCAGLSICPRDPNCCD